MPGIWLPFDGIKWCGGRRGSWLDKLRFTDMPEHHPLCRYGTVENYDVSEELQIRGISPLDREAPGLINSALLYAQDPRVLEACGGLAAIDRLLDARDRDYNARATAPLTHADLAPSR